MISSTERVLITIAVMTAALMQVLDTTIVNVALAPMQGALGASPDEISWVLTSYMVASAICMPLSGYFTDRLGQRNYLLISSIGFVLVSALCGAATNLDEMVIFRSLQGMFGAALVPLSQSILTDAYPPQERGKAMAIWGMGVMVGPVLGPTLGGYLTDIVNWRWTFYVNVPVGIFAILLALKVVPNSAIKPRSMDWWGLLYLSLAIGCLQYFLDRGNQDDWFSSTTICVTMVVSVLAFIAFLVHSLKPGAKTVFDLSIFKDRNFTLSSLMLAILIVGLYGSMVLLPLMLENLLNYPVVEAGLALAPRGLAGMIAMIVVGKFSRHLDSRLTILLGTLLVIVGLAASVEYSTFISPWQIIWPQILQGFGVGLVFVPLAVIAYATLPATSRAEASGLYSLVRTIGGSVGISICMTLLARHSQMAWNQLGGDINPYHPALYTYFNKLHIAAASPLGIRLIAAEIWQQAQMLATINVFKFLTWGTVLILPLLWLVKKVKTSEGPIEIAGE